MSSETNVASEFWRLRYCASCSSCVPLCARGGVSVVRVRGEWGQHVRKRVFLDRQAAEEAEEVACCLADEHDAQRVGVRLHRGVPEVGAQFWDDTRRVAVARISVGGRCGARGWSYRMLSMIWQRGCQSQLRANISEALDLPRRRRGP